jgi:eukaryotic-like serine/threonine-protein kinase
MYLLRSCLVVVSYLIRCEAYARHLRGVYEASYFSPAFRMPVARDNTTGTWKSLLPFRRSLGVSLNPSLIPVFSGCVFANRNENCLCDLMVSIADHIISAEPVSEGSNVYKAVRSDHRISAVQVFPFQLSRERYQLFNEAVNALAEAARHDRANVPTILAWGFTQAENYPFVETEWIDGYDLTNIPTDYKEVTVDEIGNIAEQMSRVLTLSHSVGVVHGNIEGKDILWDKEKEQYVLTGFGFGLNATERSSSETVRKTDRDSDASLKQKDIHDLGLVLLTLINAHLLPGHAPQLTNLRSTLSGTELKDGSLLPAWLGTCIYKTLTNNEDRFRTAYEMYSYIILHHKTPISSDRWSRSKPQQPLTVSPQRIQNTIKESSHKPKSVRSKSPKTGEETMRFVFDKRIALGLLIAGVLVTFSIIAQNREHGKTAMAHRGGTPSTEMQDTTSNTAEQGMNQDEPIVTAEEKKKPAKPKRSSDKQIAVQPTPATDASTEKQGRDSSLGAYKVRSKAYFHNEPDESTRRNAFIVHWNNAVLHPLKEENDFVYIVYTNDEGQTTKGWLRKKDLVRQ